MDRLELVQKLIEQLRFIKPLNTGLQKSIRVNESDLLRNINNLLLELSPEVDVSFSTSGVAFVSTSGDNATGTKGDGAKPFATLQAARNACSSGDLVYVYPGTYSSANTSLTKNGVNYYFSPGAIVNASGTIFQSTTSEFTVTGKGEFTTTAGHVYINSTSGMICRFAAKSARSTNERTIRGSSSSGYSLIEIDEISSTADWIACYPGGITGTGRFHFRGCTIKQDDGAGSFGPVYISQAEAAIFEGCDIICEQDGVDAVAFGIVSPQVGNVHWIGNRVHHKGATGVGIQCDVGSYAAGTRMIFEGSNQVYMEGSGASIDFGTSGPPAVIMQSDVVSNVASTGTNVPLGNGSVVVDAGFVLRQLTN